MAPRSAMFALVVVFAAGLQEEMWGPADSVAAFGVLEAALDKVTSLAISPEESKKAKHVAEDVRAAIAVVESKNSTLTKEQKHEKIGSAMTELQSLAGDLQKAAPEGKLEKLKEELAEKKKLLLKDESMIKLYTLQKELTEKKMALEKLIEKKNNMKTSKAQGAADAKQESEMVGKLMKLTGALGKVTDKKAELPAPIKAALAEVKQRSKKESDEIAKMEANNKNAMAEIDAMAKKSIPTLNGKDDALAKGQQMMKRLKKEEHRAFMKAKAQKVAQLTELKAIESSIEQHDAKKLTAALLKMQHEAKQEQAKSGDFLH